MHGFSDQQIARVVIDIRCGLVEAATANLRIAVKRVAATELLTASVAARPRKCLTTHASAIAQRVASARCHFVHAASYTRASRCRSAADALRLNLRLTPRNLRASLREDEHKRCSQQCHLRVGS